ncbi:MAG: hypothetical protein ACR2NP_11230 [Pirellulaceae bacterium]
MSKRYQLLAVLALAASFVGCNCCSPQGGGYPYMAGTRIAPPATGSVQIPNTSVASLPDAYYGTGAVPAAQQPTIVPPPSVAPGSGWRPQGTAPAATAPGLANVNPNVQNTSPNLIPTNNLQVATSTSTIRPTPGTTQVARATDPQTATHSMTGGMPLTDATQVAGNTPTNRPQSAWEYVVRPNGPQVAQPQQYRTQPVLANNNNVVGTGSTTPQGYATPRPGSYSYPNNAYPNNGVYPNQQGYPANVAHGWRQRTATPVPR